MVTKLLLPAACAIVFLCGCDCMPSTCPATSGSIKLVTVSGAFNTTANNGTNGDGINIDGLLQAQLPLQKIKRYTVTVHTATLSTAPAGVDRVEVYTGVWQGSASYQVRVLRQDPATAAPFPFPGITIPPYAGTNSFVKVFRGADGLGSVQVTVNAFVELEN